MTAAVKPHRTGRRVRWTLRPFHAWAGDHGGASAVEFAMVAGPMIFMVFSLLQLGAYLMVQVTLDVAAAAAARQLRTGQLIADGTSDTVSQQAFLTAVCNNMSWLKSQCQSGVSNPGGQQYLLVDVRTLNSFANSSAPPMAYNGAMNTPNFCFYSGSAGAAVEFRAFYRWQLIAPALVSSLQTFPGGIAELQSTQVFQIEPNAQSNSSQTQC